jgi:hypothetical protein
VLALKVSEKTPGLPLVGSRAWFGAEDHEEWWMAWCDSTGNDRKVNAGSGGIAVRIVLEMDGRGMGAVESKRTQCQET